MTIGAILIAVGADQLIKYFVEKNLASGRTATLLPHLIQLEYVRNYNGMWGLFEGKRELLAAFTVVVLAVGVGIILADKIRHPFPYWCAAAVIAGGAGNLIDRLFKGYVVDYIDTVFVNFPTYNLADCFVTVGCFLLMGYEFYELIMDMRLKKESDSNG